MNHFDPGVREQRIEELLDHFDIERVISTYCRGCDRGDHDMMASVYATNSWDDHGLNKCSGQEFVSRTMAAIQEGDICSHHLGQVLVTFDEGGAGAETYFTAVLTAASAAGDGKEILNLMGGRYLDRLVREPTGWKIMHRICVRDWSISEAIAEDWLEARHHVEGCRSGNDPSYPVLRQTHSGRGDDR